jgi:hypothetical protein
VIAAPSAPVSLTRKFLLPVRGVDGFEEYSSVAPCVAFMAAVGSRVLADGAGRLGRAPWAPFGDRCQSKACNSHREAYPLARLSKCCGGRDLSSQPAQVARSLAAEVPPILGGFLFIASRTGACNFDKSRARHDRHEQYISSPNYARGRPSLPSGKWYPLPSTCERAPSRSCGIATGRRPRLVAQGRGFPATA